jgi:glyoxylase-like metal-dependent hydrolase (beta-lactamase superfamily II)/rhodanese-related sulfurtransferase
MKVEQIYTNCLAEASYYIESNGEAAVIDPLRESQPYLSRAENDGAKIKYVFETHFHADFVSGHIDLARKAGAEIVYGPLAKTGFDARIAEDMEVFPLGDIQIIALHTPGHTMESTTWLLRDENGKDHSIFTGDTLFIGDVGRPDLAQKAGSITTEDLAGTLFDSLRNKIMPLADEVIVYPAHGAGSACGKNMSSETYSTLGEQKQSNYALRADMTRDEFISELTEGLAPPPAYFPENVRLNKSGYDAFDEVMNRGLRALSPDEFENLASDPEVRVIDTRSMHDFPQGHVPGSWFIGLDGSFAPWMGALVEPIDRKLIVVAPEGREEETVRRLSRVGFDNCAGYLDGGIDAWTAAGKQVATIDELEAADLPTRLGEAQVIDVRKPGEYDRDHIEVATNRPLDYIADNASEYDKNQPYYLHCKSGYRSMIAASILKSQGYEKLINVLGGFDALAQTDLARVETACSASS